MDGGQIRSAIHVRSDASQIGATGDEQDVARDIVGEGRGEKEDRSSGLLRSPGASERNELLRELAHTLGNAELDGVLADLGDGLGLFGRGQPGLDETISDGVDVDAETRGRLS